MAKADEELNDLYQQLRDELNRLARHSSDEDDPLRPARLDRLDQVDRRLIIRSAFATIDALAYRLKQVAFHSAGVSKLTAAERTLCAEESYELTSNGEAEIRTARLRFLPNLRFAFRIVAKAEGVDFSLDVSGAGWQSVQKGVQVRDRLTHPKSVADLMVTDDEARVAIAAFLWVEEQVRDWLSASVRALQMESERLQRELMALRGRGSTSAV